jgi:hypothetical protein
MKFPTDLLIEKEKRNTLRILYTYIRQPRTEHQAINVCDSTNVSQYSSVQEQQEFSALLWMNIVKAR